MKMGKIETTYKKSFSSLVIVFTMLSISSRVCASLSFVRIPVEPCLFTALSNLEMTLV